MMADDELARRARFFKVTALFWASCIVAMCLWPHPQIPGTPPIDHFDKFVHAGIFVVQGFLLRGTGLKVSSTVVLCAVLAVGTELLQAGLPSLGRSGDLLDAVADFVGVATGLLFFQLFQLWSARRSARNLS